MRTKKDSEGNFLEDPPQWLTIKGQEGKRRRYLAYFLRWYQSVYHLDFMDLVTRLGCSPADFLLLSRCPRPAPGPGYFATLEETAARYGANVDELDTILRWCDGIDVVSNENTRNAAQRGI